MKNIMRILVLVLALTMVFSLFACAKDGNGDETKAPETQDVQDTKDTEKETENHTGTEAPAEFKVTVKDQDGNVVPGVMVQICKDACIPARTGDDGVATFVIAEITSEHKLSVMSAPEGYTFSDEEIYLEDGATEYTLEITKAAE